MSERSIPIGAAAVEIETGRVHRQSGGTALGHLFAQFDGECDRHTVRIEELRYLPNENTQPSKRSRDSRMTSIWRGFTVI